ncbi:DUF4190 domain-containing protein [Actinoplanes xinjiangensis]|uniref:Uncharacterized protein DUF4190 n=1 Tax=Actinoplanes xinjiangensis TaxID=512350 RepID=A0A316F8K9_9ACTN|nr:DUF4190 domain-containing protein [Actinoplanes xinjiangensis]PWK43579.1 uncharacterized protein DUF4190 [Actinoplanes xinjiangensis]GIF41898.1 hypothetical protein Axi01nite_62090 [Actinoplanes xinjiangensis]
MPGSPGPEPSVGSAPPAGGHGGTLTIPPAHPYPVPHGASARINRFAIASLATSCLAAASMVGFFAVGLLGLCYLAGLLAPVGAILGYLAERQIRRTGDDGRGLATAGFIVGGILAGVICLLVFIVWIVPRIVGFFSG